jgi:plastocyanin
MDTMRLIRWASVIAIASALLACGSDSTASKDGLASVDVQPRDAVLKLFALWPHMHQTATNRRGIAIKTDSSVWTSSDSQLVSVDRSTGALTANAVGSADVTDAVTVDGVTKSGVSHVTVVATSVTGSIAATSTIVFTPQLLNVDRGGAAATVTWSFGSVGHTVTWDSQPPGAAVADVAELTSASASRDFTVAGIYEYHCSIHPGMTGTILVQ